MNPPRLSGIGKTIILSGLFACLLLVYGCGGSGSSDDDPGDEGPKPPETKVSVCAAGVQLDNPYAEYPGYWVAGTWTPLDGDGIVNAIALDGADVHACGTAGKSVPKYWKNGALTDLPLAAGCTSGEATSIAVSGSDVYVGGYCNGGAYIPGYWKNGGWNELPTDGTGATATGGCAYAIAASGGNIYVAGAVYVGAKDMKVVYWKNGGAAIPVPFSAAGTSAKALSIAVDGTDVWCGGWESDGTTKSVCRWKNGLAPTLLAAIPGYGDIRGAQFVGTDLYAVGNTDSKSLTNSIGYWKNGTWKLVADSTASQVPIAYSIALSGGSLYLGGELDAAADTPGYWANGTWVPLSTKPAVGAGGYVKAFALK